MVSCVEPVGGAVESDSGEGAVQRRTEEDVKIEVARVGKQAPRFAATAYFAGAFKRVSLSDYSGKWVVLCFYPGDFTFV